MKSVPILRGACVALCLVMLSGCAIFADEINRAAKAGGKLVRSYCENVTSPEARTEFRDKVNAYAAPHSVRVDCADPSTPPLVTGSVPQ